MLKCLQLLGDRTDGFRLAWYSKASNTEWWSNPVPSLSDFAWVKGNWNISVLNNHTLGLIIIYSNNSWFTFII